MCPTLITKLHLFTVVISVALATTGSAFLATACAHTLTGFLLLATDCGAYEFRTAIDDTTADPDLDTDTAVGGVSLGVGVIDVSTEGVQRGAALFEVLAAGNLADVSLR